MKVLLVNPPLTDPSGPYPSICYLAGYLDTIGIRAELADASLLVLLRLLTRDGLSMIRDRIRASIDAGAVEPDPRVAAFLDAYPSFERAIETAVACLQGADRTAIARAAREGFFPPPIDPRGDWARNAFFAVHASEAVLGELTPAQRGRILESRSPLRFAFGSMGVTDEVVYRASLVVRDVCEVVRLALDPAFALDEYATQLTQSAATFEPIASRLAGAPTPIDELVDSVTDDLVRTHAPTVVGITIPFPGNAYGAFRMAARIKKTNPDVVTIMGGGFVNTELRELSDPTVFDHVDFITLDDGELPLRCVLEHVRGERAEAALSRTLVRRDGKVVRIDGASEHDVPASRAGTPTLRGLPLKQYLCYRPSFQIMPRVWGLRWNKLTLAHGCYWKKCAFCDTSLDYIGRYDPASADALVERMRALATETGERGFHFVDEAMPPALVGHLAKRLVDEHLDVSWWGNVRFDRAFASLAPLLAESGCVLVTGGLEVASDRVLGLMEKGVSLEQAVHVMRALSDAGILVHAYLIYGFPTETEQETIDALEVVRQLFAKRWLHSAAWHKFVLTKHSPIAADPKRFGIVVESAGPRTFANYVLAYDEPGGIDHARFTDGLQQATGLYMAGIAIERPVHSFFTDGTPATTLAPDFVERLAERALSNDDKRKLALV
jgi:radical SAM superfamily enzyme YgiQ (UPF0313 family)